jgi:putative endonuclease
MSEKKVLNTRKKGDKGEDIACSFLLEKGFSILMRNYMKKWGELDIIAEKDEITHFFEVKSVIGTMAHNNNDVHKPEDNVDGWKAKHIRRMIETYFAETTNTIDFSFEFHVLSVYMDTNNRKASVKWIKNVIL